MKIISNKHRAHWDCRCRSVVSRVLCCKAVITIAIRLRYDYDSTAIRDYDVYRARLLPFDASKKITSIFRRSRVAVVSQSNSNCDIGLSAITVRRITQEVTHSKCHLVNVTTTLFICVVSSVRRLKARGSAVVEKNRVTVQQYLEMSTYVLS